MLTVLTLSLLVVILFLGAILGGAWAILRHLPVIEVKLPPFAPVIHCHVELPNIPELRIVLPEPKPVVSEVTHNEPIPDEVIEYIDQESEEHARIGRRHKVRALREELGDWPSAFRALQREDTLT